MGGVRSTPRDSRKGTTRMTDEERLRKIRQIQLKRKKKKRRKVIVTVIMAIILVLVILFGAFFMLFEHYYSKMNFLNVAGDGNTDYVAPTSGVYNVLLIGVDNDNLPGLDELGNADGLVILSINKTTRQVVMTSLMRDIYVSIPDQFNTKLTMSYHYGGVPMLIDTIEANFGVPIDNYALVNYIDVVNIVDAFGGVEIDLREDEIYAMEGKIANVNVLMGLDPSANAISQSQAGPITLNGVQTAAYLRVRMAGHGDYERTERARRVLGQLVEKARGMSVSELNDMADVVLPCITTDLTEGQILSLLVNAPQYMKYEMVSSRIPIEGSSYGADMNGYYLIVDYEVNREYLYNSIYNGVH